MDNASPHTWRPAGFGRAPVVANTALPASRRERRILTIDGGGIKGVFPAAFLAELEDRLGEPVVDYFDLIAGTSTGGIIALALGLGLTAKDILRLYLENARRIFPRTVGSALWGLFSAKYANATLRAVLAEAFGRRLLGESRTRLVIPSLNLATEHVHVYKTSHDPGLVNDYRVPAVEVALATVAAPTYFPVHLSPEGVPFIDGSVWARNPLGLAVIEAVGILGWPRDAIRVLSLGCTAARLDPSWKGRTSLGTAYWGARLADVFMNAQSSSAVVTANALIGAENVFRVDPDLSHCRFTLDGVRHLPLLDQFGKGEASKAFSSLAPLFFQEKAAVFVPCHRSAASRLPLAVGAVAAA